MYQPLNSQQSQLQLKKSNGNPNNDKTNAKKLVPIQQGAVSNKANPKRPFKSNSKPTFSSGPREKSFSKNVRKVEARNYKQQPQQQGLQQEGSGENLAIQDLLNFQYSSSRHVDVNYRSNHSYSHTRRNTRNKSFFNKEEYLQAKCQFVVVGTPEEYYANTVDPDKLVDWDKVQLVYLPSHERTCCPVCLYPPTVAKVTKCGHIFCWSCILHYLHLDDEDKSWRKCPICHEAVHEKDLKSVKSYVQTKYDRLDSISMKLMKRSKQSLFAVPKRDDENAVPKFEFASWLEGDTRSKIMLTTRGQVIKQLLMKERDELHLQLENDKVEDNGEAAFISMALNILEEEIKSLSNLDELPIPNELRGCEDEDVADGAVSLSSLLSDASLGDSCVAEAPFSDDDMEANDIEKIDSAVNRERLISECSTISNDASLNGDHCNDLVRSPTFPGETRPKSDSYHFYQAADGQNIFLHSINARSLIEEYGSLDFGPLKVKGQIIDFECYTMTKELRKRFRYLSHLPLSSEFMICELILKPPLLSKRTIHNFMPEFKHRKTLRLKKMKEQLKFDRQANAIENKKYGFHVEPDYTEDLGIDITNVVDFPCNLSPELDEPENFPDLPTNVSSSTPSFAQMLNTKSVQPTQQKRPVKEVHYRTPQYLATTSPIKGEDDDGPDVFAPDFKEMFSAAMFATPSSSDVSGVKGKNKKKKDKGMLLFATGGQRKY